MIIAFDLIELNGWDWGAAPLVDRKHQLAKLLRLASDIHYNEHFDSDGDLFSNTPAGSSSKAS